jgi:hypothetical protein
MDKIEAKQILSRELKSYRARSYDELVKCIGGPLASELLLEVSRALEQVTRF